MRTTNPYTVIQNAKPIFTVYAYSAEQAHAVAAAKVAGETIVVEQRSEPMMPRTVHNMDPLVVVSAMQKSIRRGLEKEAMQFACELIHSGKAFHTMVCNRLMVICHEDLDTLTAPHVFPFVAASLAASKERYADKPGEARLMVGNAIRIMCRSPKSRAGTHFAAAIGLRSQLEGFAPEIPDWANDQHTLAGKKLGRGLDHFREHGAKLIPSPTDDDPFEDEAYRLWALKQRGNGLI